MWEVGIALGVVLVGVGVVVVRGIRRRAAFSVTSKRTSLVPRLDVSSRAMGKVRRVLRDPTTSEPLVEIAVGNRVLVLCPADHTERADDWRLSIGKTVEIALYGLATLAPGGADTIKDQIKDADQLEITPDLLRFLRVGVQQNDYFAIGRALSHQTDSLGDDPLVVYRLQTAPDLTLDVGTPADGKPFPESLMVHGSVRLYGYLPDPAVPGP
jgi:hypothetical protein